VIVAFGSLKEDQLVEVLRTCDRLDCEIFFVPRLFELHAVSRDMDHVWGLPLVRQQRAAFRSFTWRIKRLIDAVLAASRSAAAGARPGRAGAGRASRGRARGDLPARPGWGWTGGPSRS
jgi:hypothetical protein